jgi:hypothetical protein
MPRDKDRVGARHRSTHPPAGGGGYQDTCNKPVAVVDGSVKIFREKLKPTIEDLKEIGLSGKWLEIAERVGIDMWLDIWQILDRENVGQPSILRSSTRLRVPMYVNYVRYIRNRYIHEMTDAGKPRDEILRNIKQANFEPVGISCLLNIQEQYKKRDENGE